MSQWEMVKLGDVASVYSGNSAPQEDDYFDKVGNPFIRAGHLPELLKGKDIETLPKINDNIAKKEKMKLYKKNSIVFAKSGMSCLKGYIYALPRESYVVSHLAILENNNRINYRFLKYCLYKIRPLELVRDGSYPSIRLEDIKNMKIPLPPMDVQEKIANTLDKVAGILNIQKKKLEELDNLIKSVFYEMFGDPVLNDKEWEMERLEDISELITGNTPPRKNKDNFGDYIDWIKSDNLNTNFMYITDSKEKLSKKGYLIARKVKKNSILMTCIAGSKKCIGNVAITNKEVAFNQQINGIIPIAGNVLYMYVLFLLTKPYIQSVVTMSLKGILNKTDLGKLKFIVPPIKLQNKFAEIVEKIEKQKKVVQKSINESEALFQSLMSEYFR